MSGLVLLQKLKVLYQLCFVRIVAKGVKNGYKPALPHLIRLGVWYAHQHKILCTVVLHPRWALRGPRLPRHGGCIRSTQQAKETNLQQQVVAQVQEALYRGHVGGGHCH